MFFPYDLPLLILNIYENIYSPIRMVLEILRYCLERDKVP